MDVWHKITELAPVGVQQGLLCVTLAAGVYWFVDGKSDQAFSANQDLYAAHIKANSMAATIGLPDRSDRRLEGELVTITPPTIHERQHMLKNFEKVRSILIQVANSDDAKPEFKTQVQGVIQAYNETQEKYLRWCQAQDNYEPFRKWGWLAYVVLAVVALSGLRSWWKARPKEKSKLILPESARRSRN